MNIRERKFSLSLRPAAQFVFPSLPIKRLSDRWSDNRIFHINLFIINDYTILFPPHIREILLPEK